MRNRNRIHYGRTPKKSWSSPSEYRMLTESYGILDYRDSSLKKSLSAVIDDIYNECSDCVYDCVIDNGSSEIEMKNSFKAKKYVCDINNWWIDELGIYVSYDNDCASENMAAVIAPTMVYVTTYDNNGFGKRKVVKLNYQSFEIDFNGKRDDLFVRNDERLLKGSVVLCMSQELYNKDELVYILYHELRHLFDIFIGRTSQFEINKDVIYNDYKCGESERANPNFLNMLFSYNVDDEMKIEIVCGLNKDKLECFFYDTAYILNLSEIRARLRNFEYEIGCVNKDEFQRMLKDGDEKFADVVSYVSQYFYEYYVLYKILGWMKKCVSESVKREFAGSYIKNVCDVVTDEIPRGLFGRMLGKNGYDCDCFDDFVETLMGRLQKEFLSNAVELAYEVMCCGEEQKMKFYK